MGKKSMLSGAERALNRTAKSAKSSFNRANTNVNRIIEGRVRKRRKK